jgi:hypothetical protein
MEAGLWLVADQLRANSNLTSSEYCMPVLGIIFLRHATNRCKIGLQQIQDMSSCRSIKFTRVRRAANSKPTRAARRASAKG